MREEIFSALEAGATIITSNRRLARTFVRDFHSAQIQQGRAVWRRPNVLPLDAFLDRAWHEWIWRGPANESLALLQPWQEQLIWEQVIRASPAGDSLLQIGETARNAAQAWQLIHAYRLPVDGRFEATDDWASFAAWSRDFQKRCEINDWLDQAQLPDFVARRMASGEIPKPSALYLAGFDEPSPQQSDLLRTLGDSFVIPAPHSEPTSVLSKFEDATEEIRAAAVWARRLVEHNPDADIGIVIPDLARLRGKVERIFREILDPAGALDDRERAFHVSLGPALAEYPLVHAALLFLEFGLHGLSSPGCGVFLRSPFLGGAESEWTKRGLLDAKLRRHGIWDVSISELHDAATSNPMLQRNLRRFEKVLDKLPRDQRAMDWSLDFSKLLDALGWPGDRPLSSREYQVMEAWRGALSDLASLELASPSLDFADALSRLREVAAATPFQVENEGAPIQIMGMLEASGLRFDHLWIMGLHDEALPSPASPNPFIPVSLQIENKLPHSSAEREREFAKNQLDRLLATASDVVLSYPASEGDRILSPSPIVYGHWQTAPLEHTPSDDWIARMRAEAHLEELVDEVAPPLDTGSKQLGGASLFKDMAACPFRAFAKHRLGAKALDEATLGLSYRDRGNTVHKALERIWSELGSHQRLTDLTPADLRDLISRSAATAVNGLPPGIGRKLEQRRLEKVLGDWLEIEKSRDPFTVLKPEDERVVSVGGLQVRTRADRIDELAQGGDIILDYKTGQLKTAGWDTDRPDEPQLPLYCATSDRPVAGAAFALIRVGELGFRGLAENGVSLPGMKDMRISHPVAFGEQIVEWRSVLERLAHEFRAGRAEVDPKHGACDNCGLWALCRIREFQNDRG
jgi:probable DNA repair protein